jgi:hypothetical protein
MINLLSMTVPTPAYFSIFYVSAGEAFDAGAYADFHGLNRADIDAEDVHAVQDAASRLEPGEVLRVTHTRTV